MRASSRFAPPWAPDARGSSVNLCVESLTLGIAGGLAGLALAALGIRALVSLAPADMPRLQQGRAAS